MIILYQVSSIFCFSPYLCEKGNSYLFGKSMFACCGFNNLNCLNSELALITIFMKIPIYEFAWCCAELRGKRFVWVEKSISFFVWVLTKCWTSKIFYFTSLQDLTDVSCWWFNLSSLLSKVSTFICDFGMSFSLLVLTVLLFFLSFFF